MTINVLRQFLLKAQNSKAMKQGGWVVVGIGATQSIRLIGNLILTRLLFPEAFGLIALASAIVLGVTMLSDVGVRGAVLKSKRIGEKKFMETVWTIQFIKGCLIALVILLLTIPVSNFYKEPLLAKILPFWAIFSILVNSRSVALYIYDKNLNLKRQVLAEIFAQVISVIVMVTWAYFYPTFWALVVGTVVNGAITCINSYVFFSGHFSRFRIERSTIKEVFNFGRWVLISTAIGYIVNQGDRLIMGATLTMEELGVYSIAAILASLVTMLISNLSSRLLQPLYVRCLEENNFQKIKKIRTLVNIGSSGICIVVALLGAFVVDLLYDPRYEAAGWILQLLALRSLGFCLNSSLTAFLLACGDSFSQLKYQIVNSIYLVLSMLVASQYGFKYLLLAYVSGPIVCQPLMLLLARKRGLKMMVSDLVLMYGCILFTVLIWMITGSKVIYAN